MGFTKPTFCVLIKFERWTTNYLLHEATAPKKKASERVSMWNLLLKFFKIELRNPIKQCKNRFTSILVFGEKVTKLNN